MTRAKTTKGNRANVVKASVYTPLAATNIAELFQRGAGSDGAPFVEPPFMFSKLYELYESSSILRPNVDAYITNIDSFGHHFIPTVDLAGLDAVQATRDLMIYEMKLEPTDESVEAQLQAWRRQARFEYIKLKAFFLSCCPDMSFITLRRRTRQDYEVTGNAFWEIVRNEDNEPEVVYYINPIEMALFEQESTPILITEYVKVSDYHWDTRKVWRQFTRFVRSMKQQQVYFKEFGDPRTMSRFSGIIYPSIDALHKAEPKSTAATECLHFKIHSPLTPYGVPRWIGNLPGTLGTRELDEVNYSHFKNNTIPPLALLVSGGRLGKDTSARLQEFLDDKLKGRRSFHKMLILEAESRRDAGANAKIPKMEFVPLRNVQQQDALFQEYDKRNEDKVAKAFRLPKILRGDDSTTNRAAAWASLKFADEQVFEPEREEFDSIINRLFLPALNISLWTFRSNSPIIRDPERMAEMIERLVRVGVLLPREGRELAADIFNREFENISEEWTNQPLPYVTEQISGKPSPAPSGITEPAAPAVAVEVGPEFEDLRQQIEPAQLVTGPAPAALTRMPALSALGQKTRNEGEE